MQDIYLTIVLAPLLSAMIVGFLGGYFGKVFSHSLAIIGVLLSTVLSVVVFNHHVMNQNAVFNETIYTWLSLASFEMSVGFLVDSLTATMMLVVSFVSLMVHIYTIGYMKDDGGYSRFFSYISLFTFAMLMLVMSNNFLQLFFGWEAVGLVSYLLIGFWFKKPSAVHANLKAFLVNRVGDFGFLLGIALIFIYSGSLDYQSVFSQTQNLAKHVIFDDYSLMTVICLLLFVGAMGKSAQVPLHVWLPDSMEGPTPISALIHAATMVTAGIFMVSRMSPLFELSQTALMVVMMIGAITALFMGVLGCVQNDIKRVVAYSTLSQLGYMTVALGLSAYSIAIFHLVTHAFFKALLFLAAGSVIVALHHQQDMTKMGALWRKMPITYVTSLIGVLALIGMPGLAGFYSKDLIIEASAFSNLPWANNVVHMMLLLGVFTTAFYSLRLLFMVFHGKPGAHYDDVKESPYVITLPLILLAILSLISGAMLVEWVVLGKGDLPALFSGAIFVASDNSVMADLRHFLHTPFAMVLHAVDTAAFWAMLLGAFMAWLWVIKRPSMVDFIAKYFHWLYCILKNGYGFDRFNELFIAKGARLLGVFFSRYFDSGLIDRFFVNGSARLVGIVAGFVRHAQTGYVYHYALLMVIALALMLFYLLFVY